MSYLKIGISGKIKSSGRLTARLGLFFLAVIIQPIGISFAQVISNNGAAVTLTNGVYVESKDLDNNSGIIENEGVINLGRHFTNSFPATASGNGFYNLKGDWSNYGTFQPDTSTVTLNGILNQAINHGSVGETFYFLNINNPGRIVSHNSLVAGSTLTILKDLSIFAGTLEPGSTTKDLNINGNALVNGGIAFNAGTLQTANIYGNLSGTGSINMSGGGYPHLLNLLGASNSIGSLQTAPGSYSTVDYKGLNQTVFSSPNYRNLDISNSGTKTLQGNSTVGNNIRVKSGTVFDLGTIPTQLIIVDSALIDGVWKFSNGTVKTVNIGGDLSGGGTLDMSGDNLTHLLNLEGINNAIGIFTAGGGSTVDYIRSGNQEIFTSPNYRNLRISGSGIKSLSDDVTASGTLAMLSGNIDASIHTLILTNPEISAVDRQAGTVIGRLRRAVGFTGGQYLYPVGSFTTYNPLKIKFRELVPGDLTARFRQEDIDTIGLPLDDDGNEVWNRFPEGFWSLNAVNGMSSGDYDLILNYNGFSGVDSSSRILKRTNGGPLTLDGTNGFFNPDEEELERDTLVGGISDIETDFAIGKGRPKIVKHPEDIDICEGTDAFFEVTARGHGKRLTYQWQVDMGGGFSDIPDTGVYSGTKTRRLIITGAPFSMNGYRYRVRVTDGSGNFNLSNSALLTVNKIPIAVATPDSQDACPDESFINVVFSTQNNVSGTTFEWVRNNPSGISSTIPLSGAGLNIGDAISGSFANSTDAPITVTFTVIPTGPLTTFCVGDAITFTITVNPVPKIFPQPVSSIQCDSTTTSIPLNSPSQFTTGVITFKYTASASGGVTGFSPSVNGLPDGHVIQDFLVNPTTSVQTVTYIITPVSPVGCLDGPSVTITVKVNPTPRINAILLGQEYVCDTASININFTTGNPVIEGEYYYWLESSYTGDVSGVMETEYYPISQPISDVLVNNTRHLQTITYRIKPVFLSLGGLEFHDCERGIDTTITIYLNPTAVFDSVLVSDTVICNESFISFEFYNSQITSGTVIYELKGIFNLDSITGVRPDGPYLLNPFTDQLTNNSTTIQNITYVFTPVIRDDTHGLYCDKGIPESPVVKVTPTLQSITSPFTYIGGNNIRCFNESNGSIDISPYGGYYLSDYSYSWSRNGVPFGTPDEQDQGNLNAGSYKYRVEDIIGCFVEDSAVLTQPDLLTAVKDSLKNVSCEGKLDGAVYITVSGGVQTYRFRWMDDDQKVTTNEDLTGEVRYGDHFLRILDVNNCQFNDTFEILKPAPMQISFDISHYGDFNISCYGASDGSINTIASGNGPPEEYQYYWLNELGTALPQVAVLENLVATRYYVTVVDTFGCEGSATTELRQPDPIGVERTGAKQAADTFDISCFNSSDGIIELAVTGGHTAIGGVNYSWEMNEDPGFSDSIKNINGLRAGTYNLVIRDAYLCEKDTSFRLIQPDEMILDTTDISNFNGYQVSCINSNNSLLDLNLSGGYNGYSYTWSTSDGELSETGNLDQSGLPAGNYHLHVVDGINCTADWDFVITEPDSIEISPVVYEINGWEISCFNGSDGSISLNTGGGVEPYRFEWTSEDVVEFGDTTENLSGLVKGTYRVKVTDNNNCQAEWSFILEQPEILLSSIDTSTISCYRQNDGAAGLTVTGGQVPYVFQWSNGAITKDISSLDTGMYYVEITDANLCVIRDSAHIGEPPDILIDLQIPLKFNGRMISCHGESDADISSSVSGGNEEGNYEYLWRPTMDRTSGINNVPAGLYYLDVTDINHCLKTDSIEVIEPLRLITEVYETDPTCFGKPDGEITLIVQGGTPGYSIVWNNGQIGQTIEGIGVGRYDVLITDLNSCFVDTFGILEQPELIQFTRELRNPTCPDIFDGFLHYSIEGGIPPYDLRLNERRVDEFIEDLGEGSYKLVITDNNLCMLTDSADLKGISPICVTVPNAFSPNADGDNDTWIIEDIELYPDVKIEVYNRWGELIYYAPKGYTKPWDGTYKGRELPIDSYFYIIDLNNGRDVLSGNITLLR